ncbi:unnamed protein product, partial [Coffea canephora]
MLFTGSGNGSAVNGILLERLDFQHVVSISVLFSFGLTLSDISHFFLEIIKSPSCIALSKNDSCVMSASDGKVSLFNMMAFKVMTTFMPLPLAITYLAFHPQDNNIIAIGMEDSTIQIYNVRVDEVKTKLKGHHKQITGLAFSQNLNVLVSFGADAQASLCIWNIDGWQKKKMKAIQAPPGHTSPVIGETKVQFHNDQCHSLVSHESQVAVYDTQLECLNSASICYMTYPRDALSASISSATYSCNGLSVYTGFLDSAIGIFDADSLRLHCWIALSIFMPSSIVRYSNDDAQWFIEEAGHAPWFFKFLPWSETIKQVTTRKIKRDCWHSCHFCLGLFYAMVPI